MAGMKLRAVMLAVTMIAAAGAQSSLPERLDERISSALAAYGAPSVSVAVVREGKLAYAKAFGKADVETGRTAGVDTRYAIGSISKQFTAAAMLLLADEGKLSVDDKVAKYFPDLTRANEITIRQLLAHTSGYQDYAPQDYIIPDWKKPMTSEQIVNTWAKKPLAFDPGTRYQYSNTGYVLAALIFEKTAGEPLGTYLKRKIFSPLEMTSAGDCNDRVPQDASAHTRYALGPYRLVPREAPSWYHGAGQLCMTPSDVAKWNMAFIGKRILSPNSFSEFMREVKLSDGRGARYALGLSLGGDAANPSYSHGGEVSGFLALNQIYPSASAAITVLSNADNNGVTSAVAAQIAPVVLGRVTAEQEAESAQVRSILEGLRKGKIDRSLFTENANDYFSPTAVEDFRVSLEGQGPLRSLMRMNESQRGGMTHLMYRAVFDRKQVLLNLYRRPDGKWDQFMVTEQ